MSYTKTIVCLASSVKYGGVCIAGREIGWGIVGPWIRPISSRPNSELTVSERAYESRGLPRLLEILDVPLLAPSPHGHQVENHLIDPTRRWLKRAELPASSLPLLAEPPEVLWTNSSRSATGIFNCMSPPEAAAHTRSLYLIACPKLFLERLLKPNASAVFRGTFQYNGVQYKLPVTDPVATAPIALLPDKDPHAYVVLRNVYLSISLTEPFKEDGRCHKLIAAVITDPPPVSAP